MITHNYKKVAKELSVSSKHSRKDLEAVQLAMGDIIKEVIESADVGSGDIPNVRIKGLGIFRVSWPIVKYYRSKKKGGL